MTDQPHPGTPGGPPAEPGPYGGSGAHGDRETPGRHGNFGAWQPVPGGGDYDPDQTMHVSFAAQLPPEPRPGEDPLGAHGPAGPAADGGPGDAATQWSIPVIRDEGEGDSGEYSVGAYASPWDQAPSPAATTSFPPGMFGQGAAAAQAARAEAADRNPAAPAGESTGQWAMPFAGPRPGEAAPWAAPQDPAADAGWPPASPEQPAGEGYGGWPPHAGQEEAAGRDDAFTTRDDQEEAGGDAAASGPVAEAVEAGAEDGFAAGPAADAEAGGGPGPGEPGSGADAGDGPEAADEDGGDAGAEAGPDAAADPRSDADARLDPDADADPDLVRDPDPDLVLDADADAEPEPEPEPVEESRSEHPLASYTLRVNGTERPVTDAWLGESLLYVLRERLGLAGAKDGCEQGECGACSVQVDGRLVASCLVPAATAAGSEVRTVEGLTVDGRPSDVQRALAECGAVQCGFCIPGMAMTVHDLLEGNHRPTDLDIRQALSGNLCRCSGYRGVVDAVRQVAAERGAGDEPPDDTLRVPHQAGTPETQS